VAVNKITVRSVVKKSCCRCYGTYSAVDNPRVHPRAKPGKKVQVCSYSRGFHSAPTKCADNLPLLADHHELYIQPEISLSNGKLGRRCQTSIGGIAANVKDFHCKHMLLANTSTDQGCLIDLANLDHIAPMAGSWTGSIPGI